MFVQFPFPPLIIFTQAYRFLTWYLSPKRTEIPITQPYSSLVSVCTEDYSMQNLKTL